MLSDIILSDNTKPGRNRVVSHNFLKTKGIGDDHPMESHAVYYVHPPGTRSKPASVRSHFMMVVPKISAMCMIVWIFFECIPYIQLSLATFSFNMLHGGSSTNVCNIYLQQKYDPMKWIPTTWFRPFFSFLWTNTAFALVQLLQDDIKKKFKRWYNNNNGHPIDMYGLPPTDDDLNDNQQMLQKQIKKPIYNIIILVNLMFFAMSYGDFHLLTGTIIIGVVGKYYEMQIQKCVQTYYETTNQDNNPPLPNNQLNMNINQHRRRIHIRILQWTSILPCLFTLYRIVMLIGISNIYHIVLSIICGVVVGILIGILYHHLFAQHGNARFYQITIQCVISLIIVLCMHQTTNLRYYSLIVYILCLFNFAGIVGVHIGQNVEAYIIRQLRHAWAVVFEWVVYLLILMLIYFITLFLGTTSWNGLFGDVHGITLSLSIFTIVYYCFEYFIKQSLPNID